MRLVLDTNVVVSGLLWSGAPALLIDLAAAGQFDAFTSPALIRELARTLHYPKLQMAIARASMTPTLLVDRYAAVAHTIAAPPLAVPRSRDPADDEVLACALAAAADRIVTGDRDLLDLGAFQGIPIVVPTTAAVLLTSP